MDGFHCGEVMKKILAALAIVCCFSTSGLAQEFVLGLIPELNVFRQMERHKPMADYLSAKLGVPVRLTMLSRYGNIIDSFVSSKMDGAFWGSFTGAMAIQKLGVVPLARPVWTDGTSTYQGLVFARRDSGIDSVEQLKGKSFAFVDHATTAGYLYPLALLREKGVTNIDKFFSSYFFSGSHDAAILSVLKGEADAGAAKNTVYQLVAKDHPEITRELKILGQSESVPSNTLCVRKNLDPSLMKKLSDALLNMDKDPQGQAVLKEYGAVRFIPTPEADYAPVFDMAKRAGVDLRQYLYDNR
jgi:phosphonate transport system substrate-binding protein